jgi:hypothetical protein
VARWQNYGKNANSAQRVGVFHGSRRLTSDGITVLPLAGFLRERWSGTLIT